MKILVAYASAHGTTGEIATFISNTLEVYGADVTHASVETIEDIKGYDAFILGSAIHEGIWLRSMMLFIDKFEAELAQKPVYFFISCIRIVEADGRRGTRQAVVDRYSRRRNARHRRRAGEVRPAVRVLGEDRHCEWIDRAGDDAADQKVDARGAVIAGGP